MKKLIVFTCLLSLLLGLSACSSYFYSSLSSNDPAGEMNERNEFVQENDSVCITYSFNGENAPVKISIYNKLNEPLFVDWQRSALIVGDVSTSYFHENATISGKTESRSSGDAYKWSRRYTLTDNSSSGSFSGEVQMPKGVESIPPKSRIESVMLELDNLSFKDIPNHEYKKQPFAKSNSELVSLQVREYTEDDSPLRFRSYLALYTTYPNGDKKEYRSFERSFYLSTLVKAGNVAPSNFLAIQKGEGNCFYVHDYKKGRNAGLIIGAVAIGTAGVVLDSTLNPDYD